MASFKLPFQRPKSEGEHERNAATVEYWTQRYAMRATMSGNQTLTNNASTKLEYDTVANPSTNSRYEDQHGRLLNTASFEYQVPADGLYTVHGRCAIVPSGNIRCFMWVGVNGAETSRGPDIGHNGPTARVTIWVNDTIGARRGDVIALYGFISTTGNLNTIDNTVNYFTVHRSGPWPDDRHR